MEVEMYCIKFQKRGMPHMHLVCKFESLSPDQLGEMDEWCWAEVHPAEVNDSKAREQVLALMVHRKCGAHNINSFCTQNDRNRPGVKVCGKKHPQPFRDAATINPNTGRAEYRRRDTGEEFPYTHRVNGKYVETSATNRDIVAYNICLLSKDNSHYCVNVCRASSVLLYIYTSYHSRGGFCKGQNIVRRQLNRGLPVVPVIFPLPRQHSDY